MNKEFLTNPAIEINDEYAFGEEVAYVIPKIEHDIRPKGNQSLNSETKQACTICGAVNQIIRLFGLDLTPEQTNILYIEVVKYCTKYGYVIGAGRYIPSAINAVIKRWNEIGYKTFNKEKIFRERVDWDSPKVEEALKNGHLVGFGKELNWYTDQKKGLVYKDKYDKTTGHRLNYKHRSITYATGGADGSNAEIGCYDNYYGNPGQEYFIKERKKYIFKGVYGYAYIILPQSCMCDSVEEAKKRIAELKAVNAVIAVLTSTRGDLPQNFQDISSSYATALRDKYPEARKLEEDQTKKVYQSVVDFLSYAWKYAGEDEQKQYSDLASYLRKKYNLK